MATVVDHLVISLGLDPRPLQSGLNQVKSLAMRFAGPETVDAQIESVKTLFTLRKEALMLHIDFLAAGGESASTPAAAKAGAVIRPHTPKTSHR